MGDRPILWEMVWLFERDKDAVRVETRYDKATAAWLLILHRRNGSQIERFENEVTFRVPLEQQFDAERWQRTGPFLLRDGWRV